MNEESEKDDKPTEKRFGYWPEIIIILILVAFLALSSVSFLGTAVSTQFSSVGSAIEN